MTVSAQLDERGKALWSAAIEQWDHQPRHDAFVQHCFATGRLAAAATGYGARLKANPNDQRAARMRDRVLSLSMKAMLSASPRPVRRAFVSSPWFMVVILLGATLGAALGIIYGALP